VSSRPPSSPAAHRGLTQTLSPNARLQNIYQPMDELPDRAAVRIGQRRHRDQWQLLAHAYTSAVTLGVLLGYVVGKPVAVVGVSWLLARLPVVDLRPPVGWAAVLGSGTIAGIGFTVSLLIATRAFHGEQLDEAKLGALSAALVPRC